MVELVDTQRSERCGRKVVEVQVLFRPPDFRKVVGLESRSPPRRTRRGRRIRQQANIGGQVLSSAPLI